MSGSGRPISWWPMPAWARSSPGCETGLPMIVMPRRAELGEHRNDHQSATARRLSHLPGLSVAEDEEDFWAQLSSFRPLGGTSADGGGASPALLSAIRDFVSARCATHLTR